MKKRLVLLYLELKKSSGKHIFILLSTVIFQTLFILWNMKNKEDYSQGWLAIMYNMSILNSIILPTVMSAFSSHLIDTEHKANSYKLISTIQSPALLFESKILYGLINILSFCLLQTAGLLFVADVYRFPDKIPIYEYSIYFITTFLVCYMLFVLQLILSFMFKNQAIGLSVGILGSLVGIFISFLPKGIFYMLIPWGLFGATSIVTLDWNEQSKIVNFYFSEPLKGGFASVFIWLSLLLLIGYKLFSSLETEDCDYFNFTSQKTDKEFSRKKNCLSSQNLSKLPPELIKLKRSPLWIIFLLIPAISAFSGSLNYLGNIDILQDEWYSLWTQHSLFFCAFFMPALLGIYCSYLWQLEHYKTNWNQLLILSSYYKIVIRKLITASSLLGLTLLWQLILFLISGKICGISAPIPQELISWLLCGFIGGVSICSFHILLSLVIRSFAIPVIISIIGGIIGLVFMVNGYWYMSPYSIFCIGMRANNPDISLNLLIFIPVCFVFIILSILLSILYISKTDVQTS